MKKIMSLLLAAVMLLSFAACSGNGGGQTAEATQEPTEAPTAEPTPEVNKLTAEQCIGTWKVAAKGAEWFRIVKIELYKGGAGKGYTSSQLTDIIHNPHYSLTWEIVDDLLIVSWPNMQTKIAFELDGNTLVSTDGESAFIKQE